MKKISLKDIAKRAGVSPATVSGVINGKASERRISSKVAEQVAALARETGYQPNRTAVSLRTGKSHVIGLIVEDISNAFFSTLAKTVEDVAYSLGYRIVFCSTENNDDKGNELLQMLHQQVDGFLITPSKGMEPAIAELLKGNKPVVLMDRYFPDLNTPSVIVQNFEGVKIGVDHLLQKGYSKIAFVTVDLQQIQMQQRELGYKEAVKNATGHYSEKLILKLPYQHTKADAIKQITAFVRKNRDIDAIFFATNYLGVYGLQSAAQLGLSIPDDIALVCFDDHEMFDIVKPPITIIKQPIEEIAKTAIKILLCLIEGKPTFVKQFPIVKATKLIIRSST